MTDPWTRWPARIAAGLGLAWWLDRVITVEWSFPYCSSLEDGPAGAVYGFPLPYHHASVATSLTQAVVPWRFAVDLLMVAAVCVALGSLTARGRLGRSIRLRRAALVAGALLLVVGAMVEALEIRAGARLPVGSLDDGYLAASELRPVAVRGPLRPRDCTPSRFWFPRGWRPSR